MANRLTFILKRLIPHKHKYQTWVASYKEKGQMIPKYIFCTCDFCGKPKPTNGNKNIIKIDNMVKTNILRRNQ